MSLQVSSLLHGYVALALISASVATWCGRTELCCLLFVEGGSVLLPFQSTMESHKTVLTTEEQNKHTKTHYFLERFTLFT